MSAYSYERVNGLRICSNTYFDLYAVVRASIATAILFSSEQILINGPGSIPQLRRVDRRESEELRRHQRPRAGAGRLHLTNEPGPRQTMKRPTRDEARQNANGRPRTSMENANGRPQRPHLRTDTPNRSSWHIFSSRTPCKQILV